VLDDDYSTSQFPDPPLVSLDVTAAHEFFHAVQFAYDYFEDSWLMEGTPPGSRASSTRPSTSTWRT
jgi:hypothetical protein